MTGSLHRETAHHDEDEEAVPLVCRDCPMWYGEEDKGWGPCSIKHQRGAVQFITFGGHSCDEGYQPPVHISGHRRRAPADSLRAYRAHPRTP